MSLRLSRRGLLLGLSATLALGSARVALAEAPGERRLVVIVLRGAMDGLYAVQPYADPGLAELRAALALPEPGREGGLLDLGGRFGLHPGFANLHAMFAAGEAAVLHAVAGPYRSRSHFEAQDLLEGGGAERLTSGWLNRALAALPPRGTVRPGLAVGVGTPFLMRGPTPIGTFAPQVVERPSPDLLLRIADLHTATDPGLGAVLQEGLRARGFAAETLGAATRESGGFPALCTATGRLLAAADGPRVAAMEIGGWDTHAGQASRILGPIRALDGGLGALKAALGEEWRRTAVLVVTEFGRTARVNGNAGTDHGTGGVAFLAGGAVQGARVIADWPGLAPARLFENRDLQPTMDLRRVAKGLLRDHLRLPERAVAQAFPGSDEAPALGGLIRA